jgi:hypothetical protein
MSLKIYKHFVNISVTLARGGQLTLPSMGGDTWKTSSAEFQFFCISIKSAHASLFGLTNNATPSTSPVTLGEILLCGNNLTSNFLVEQQSVLFGCLCFAK